MTLMSGRDHLFQPVPTDRQVAGLRCHKRLPEPAGIADPQAQVPDLILDDPVLDRSVGQFAGLIERDLHLAGTDQRNAGDAGNDGNRRVAVIYTFDKTHLHAPVLLLRAHDCDRNATAGRMTSMIWTPPLVEGLTVSRETLEAA
jgi:hypothetical protein